MLVRYAEAAENDLKAIYLTGVETYGARRAEAYVAGLRQAVQRVSDFPLAARLRQTIQPPVRARRFQAHMIIYIVDETGVLILRFRHVLEDWQDDGAEEEP